MNHHSFLWISQTILCQQKPLVEEGKEENKDDDDNKEYTVNKGADRRNIVQKWKESSIGRRIDMISSILFPLLFIVYVITFFAYEGLRP